jgi:hypothetical protein
MMESDNEQVHVAFHNMANDIFFQQVDSFNTTVKDVSRKEEEYRFQQAKEEHINTLKQKLETCASALLQKHRHNRQGQLLDQNLQLFIKQYLHLFVQKTRRD